MQRLAKLRSLMDNFTRWKLGTVYNRRTRHCPELAGSILFAILILASLRLSGADPSKPPEGGMRAAIGQSPALVRQPEVAPIRGRVLFLGDSITYDGKYIEFLETSLRHLGWPHDLEVLNVGLPSETVSGLSEPGHAGGAFPRPDLHERLERVLKQTRPDIVFACYGMNDGIYYPFAEERFKAFHQGNTRMRALCVKYGARIVHLTPPVFDPIPIKDKTLPAGQGEYPMPFSGYNGVLNRYAEWLLNQREQGWEVVDVHGPINTFLTERRKEDPAFRLAGDGVHPDSTGHWLITREILAWLGLPPESFRVATPEQMAAQHPEWGALLKPVQNRQRLFKDTWLRLTGHSRPGMGQGLPLEAALQAAEPLDERIQAITAPTPTQGQPFPGRRSEWNGFQRFDFPAGEKMVTVIAPAQGLPGKSWAWKAEFLDAFPATEIALLKRGYHIVYLSVPDMLGSPEAVRHWNACYRDLTLRRGLGKKPALIALSRGGLYAYNWAAANPDSVSCIYADAAVCDFKSWPGGKGTGKGSARDWELVIDRFHFKSEGEALASPKNPVDNLQPLAQAAIPLLHVYGDADDVVPWEENTGRLAQAYRTLGGEIRLISKPGIGHHPHGLPDPKPVVDFIVKHSTKP